MKYNNVNPKQDLLPHEIVKIPWYKLACDLFECDKKSFFLLVNDYYSKYLEVGLLSNGTTSKSAKQCAELPLF